MTRQRDLEFSSDVGQSFSILHQPPSQAGHRQIRNRGTIGGSLCHLDPAAELVNLAALYDGVLHARSPAGSRDLGFAEFASSAISHILMPDKVLSGVSLRSWSPNHGWAFVEMSRRQGDFAVVAVGALLQLDAGGRIGRIAIPLSGLGPLPYRPAEIECGLHGQAFA